MSDRLSSITLNEKIGVIPENRWETFCKHVQSLKGHLAGRVETGPDAVKISYVSSDTLYFPRDTESVFPGDDTYMIHAQHWPDNYPSDIAAMIMLFRQDCLDNNPKCSLDGDFNDAMEGMLILKDANVWTGEAPRCLLFPKDVEKDFEKAKEAAYAAFKAAWEENEVPEYTKIWSSIDKAVLDITPKQITDMIDEWDWLEYVYVNSRLERRKFGMTQVKDNGEVNTYWHRDSPDGRKFAYETARSMGLEYPSDLDLPKEFTGLDREVVYTTHDLTELPYDSKKTREQRLLEMLEKKSQTEYDDDDCSPCP